MGIFDSPAVSLRKRLPDDAKDGYDKFLPYVESLVPDYALSRTRQAYVLGVALGSILIDSFRNYEDNEIPDRDFECILKKTDFFRSRLGNDVYHAAALVLKLHHENFIIDLPEWVDEI